jgi:hypothetical protein
VDRESAEWARTVEIMDRFVRLAETE